MTGVAGASVWTSPNQSGSQKKRVRQKLSHRRLMRDLSAVAPPTSRRRPLDAIIVPSIRRAHHLRPVARLAAETGTLLVVLTSREARIDDVAALVASTTGCRALVVEVPEGYGHDFFTYETSTCLDFQSANANRQSDLSLKRNIGLLLAKLLSWHKIMYLDDDIYGIHAAQLAKVSAQLDNYPVAGLVTRHYPDNSVVCHANRVSGANQDNFITGSALGVNCARTRCRSFQTSTTRTGSSLSNTPPVVASLGSVRRINSNTSHSRIPLGRPVRNSATCSPKASMH